MSGDRPGPGDDDLLAMLEARADRASDADVRAVLAAVRVEVEGPGAGVRGGRVFGVRPVRSDRPVAPARGSRMPWRLAVLGVAAVVAVAFLGSRLSLGPNGPDAGTSPTVGSTASTDPVAGSLEPWPTLVPWRAAPPVVLDTAGLRVGLAVGSLEGRTVIVDAPLAVDPIPCPSPAGDECFGLHVEGVDGVEVVRSASITRDVVGAHAGQPTPFALRVAGGTVTLLGWVVDGLATPRSAVGLAAADPGLAAGDLIIVRGWLQGSPGVVSCLQAVPCPGPWPRLTDDPPYVDGAWIPGLPGLGVSTDPSLGIDGPENLMAGRFLVGPLRPTGSGFPPYRVVAAVDAEVQPVDVGTAPVILPAGTIAAEEMARALRSGDGSLDGKLLVVDGRLHIAFGRCRFGATGDCTFVQLEGLGEVFIDKGSLTAAAATAAIARHPGDGPIALLVKDSGVSLVGWLVAGSAEPVGVAWLLPAVATLPAGDVAVVDGWVIGPGSATGCPYSQVTTCPGEGPWLTATAPMPDGTPLLGTVAIAVDVVSTLQLRDAPDEIAGPFLVRGASSGSGSGARFEVAGLFSDVVRVLESVSASGRSPSPAP